ncbi:MULTISPECIES: hypothetical protein [unclassified Bradyrhizobium]|uniref:hypothetical protein n=1 Tax=unclassified Bradyrhizobium TaxID=2631580 RepID=UPI0029163B22|nr:MULTISPECIES: hypothetical protein [unclassified Bradyrhizobium]
MRPIIWLCIVLFTAAMTVVRFGVHAMVGSFGGWSGIALALAVYAAVVYFERRRSSFDC